MRMPKRAGRKDGPLLIDVLAALRAGETLRYGFAQGAPRWWQAQAAGVSLTTLPLRPLCSPTSNLWAATSSPTHGVKRGSTADPFGKSKPRQIGSGGAEYCGAAGPVRNRTDGPVASRPNKRS